MKTKTDLYTKIVLTVIAIALVGNLLKDISFVTKAQASELDLSALKIENASDEEGTTFYIYENDKVLGGFGKKQYTDYDFFTDSPSMTRKGSTSDEYKKGYINPYYDTPKYIITTKTGSFWLKR